MAWYIRACPICGGDLHDNLDEKGWVSCFLCARSFRAAEIRGGLVTAGTRPVAGADARESGRRRRVPPKAA
jgi:hypothetical protein